MGAGYAPPLHNLNIAPYTNPPPGLQHYPPEMYPAIRGYSIGADGRVSIGGPGTCGCSGCQQAKQVLGEEAVAKAEVAAKAKAILEGHPGYGIPPVNDAGPSGMPYAVLRRVLVGFDSGTGDIAAAATFSVSVTIQIPFRPERFHVNPLTAANFILSQIVIGVIPQLAAVGNVPAAMFVPEATLPLTFDTAQQGQVITISGTNISGSAARFLAGMVGTALR